MTEYIIESNKYYTGNISDIDSKEDVDYYKVSIPDSGTGQLIIQTPRQTTDKMFKAELYKSDNMSTPIDTLYSTSNPTAYGNERTLSPGDYYIAIKKGAGSADSHVDYKIQLSFNKVILMESMELSLLNDTYYVNDKATIKTNIAPSNTDNKTLTWESVDKKVVTVDSSGKITCVGAGKAYVTAKSNDGSKVEATILITVKEKETNNNKDTSTVKKSSNANLSKLKISTGKLNKKFSSKTTTYTLTLGKNTNKVKITPTTAHKSATLTIDDKKVKDTTVLILRKSKTINIKVKAENGSVKTYKITVKRK